MTDDVTYVSLNYDNPDQHSTIPWCGTHAHAGPESIVKTFVDVGLYWQVISFEPEAVFAAGENAAMFGRFTHQPTVMSKLVTTPFAGFAKVKDGRCYPCSSWSTPWPPALRFAAGDGRSAATARSPSDGCVNGHTIDSGAL